MADSTQLLPRLSDWPAWPAYALVNDLLPTLATWSAAGQRCALATLIEIQGSSPRPVGSEMAVAADGSVAGYVSGGCVEAAVAQEALAALADNRPRLLHYGAGSPVLDVQLSCGGGIRILVRGLADAAAYVAERQRARSERRALGVRTRLADGRIEFRPDDESAPGLDAEGAIFRQRHLPPLRLVVAGHDPISLALLQLAPAFDIETVLLRPLGPEAGPSAPLLRYERRALDAALAELACDRWTAVYTLTHDAEADHALLCHALRSPAYCVGALGSRRKAELRRARLRAEGFDEAQLARLHSPAGLDLGAQTPQQIALSILGQLIAERPR